MSDRIKIGLVTPAWPGDNTPNGITTAVFNLARGLRDIGHDPIILTRVIDGTPPEGFTVVDMRLPEWSLVDKVRAKLDRSHVKVVNRRLRVDALAKAINTAQADLGLDIVIVEETHGWAGDVVPLVEVPVVICLHGPWLVHRELQSWGSEVEDEAREAAERHAFEVAAGILSPSRSVLEAIEGAYDLGDKPREVVANSLSLPTTDLPKADGPILFVGRFDLHKGGDTVLAAFEDLSRTHPEARLTFAGPNRGLRGSDGNVTSMDAMLADLPAETRARIDVLGQQDADQVAQLRRTHPVALIASRFEVFGYTMLEAMAAGQAIVSTEVGGPGEILKHGETALLVPPDDPEAMANALRVLQDDPEKVRHLGNAAKEDVETRFTPRKIAAETVEFCKRVLAHSTQQRSDDDGQSSSGDRKVV